MESRIAIQHDPVRGGEGGLVEHPGPLASDAYARNHNALWPQDRAAHDWFRFVLSFPPHLVRHYLQRFGVGQQHRIQDPFCGTGTLPVECRKLGIPSVGIEAHPLLLLIALELHFVTQPRHDEAPPWNLGGS